MTKFDTIFARAAAALALALGCAGGPALAAPIYHVDIDTRPLSGQAGYLDFLYLGLANAAPTQASLTHLAGDFGASSFTYGDAGGAVGTGLTLGSGDGYTEYGLWARLGGSFSFDLSFGEPADADAGAGIFAGSSFTVALLDDAFHYLGASGDLVTISLKPGEPDAVFADAGYAAVHVVPEPSSAWLGAAGLLLLAGTRRRRRVGEHIDQKIEQY
jgi:MYXO-CTERM domain-containing protein